MDIVEDYDWAGILGTIVIVLLILIVTWIVARLVRWAVAKLVSRIGFLQREGADGQDVGTSIGQIVALLIWLFGLIAVLQVLELEQVLGPLQGMLETILNYLPNIIGAAVVFFIGYLIAKIVKQIIVAALGTVNFARMIGKARSAAARETGAEPTTTGETYDPAGGTYRPATGEATAVDTEHEARETNARIASVLGNLAFAVIIIVVAIAALQVLGISAISDPATDMLNLILQAIPLIIAALIILGIGYLIARFVADLLEGTLRGIGTDEAIRNVGVTTGRTSPSTIIAKIAQVAIVVFFAIMAAQLLGFATITNLLDDVLALTGRVLFGGAIIAVGFFVANLIRRAIGEGTAGTILRYATIILFSAIGLQFMGLADSIINLAFGSIVVGAALAAALAYGLGGRDVAHRSLERLERSMETSPTAPPRTTPPPPTTPPTPPPSTTPPTPPPPTTPPPSTTPPTPPPTGPAY